MADTDDFDEATILEQAMDCHLAGDQDRAIELCTQLIEADDSWAQPFYFRGAARLAKGDAAGALPDLGRALDLEPNIPAFAYHDRGRALAALERHEEALLDYERAVQLEPAKASTRNRMGTSLYHLGRLEEALTAYSEAIRLAPEQADYHFDRGALHLARGQFEEAIADFTRAIHLEPNAENYFSRGTAHLRRGDFEGALADLEEAVRRDAKHARAWYARGYAHYVTRRTKQGLAEYTTAVELDPSLRDWPYERRWLGEQRERATAYLRSRGLSGDPVAEEAAWDLAPYLALWPVGPRGSGLWVITGDGPTDHLRQETAEDPRAAIAAFGRRWQRAAANVLAGRADPEIRLGPPERWPELGPMLQTRAEWLLECAANDGLWEEQARAEASG
jgi:tetratricopeptide (TPR) repeat protein